MKIYTIEAEDAARSDESDPPSSSQQLNVPFDIPQAGLSPQRLQQIRQRIRSGFYDSAEVVDKVARRILDSAEFRG